MKKLTVILAVLLGISGCVAETTNQPIITTTPSNATQQPPVTTPGTVLISPELTPVIPVKTKPTIWTIQYSPYLQSERNHLAGIWGSSSKDVFAVGSPGVLHYDGSNWAPMDTRTSYGFSSVWGTSSKDVYVAGGVNLLPSQGVVMHFDGNNWTTLTDSIPIINSIWGTSDSDIFAVGLDYHENFWETGVVTHYDGKEWIRMKTDLDTKTHYISSLQSVWGSSSSDVYAVGYGGTIEHYDGKEWQPVSWSPDNLNLDAQQITNTQFSSVWGTSPSDIYVTGSTFSGLQDPLFFLLHYDGKTWTAISGINDNFLSIWGTSSSNFFIAGLMKPGHVPSKYYGVVQHFDGNTWDRQLAPNSSVAPGYSIPILGIWGVSPNDVFAVDELGDILHYSGSPQ